MHVSLPSLHDYDVKLPKFTFYGGRCTPHKDFIFLLVNLHAALWNSTPEKNRQHFNLTKTESWNKGDEVS